MDRSEPKIRLLSESRPAAQKTAVCFCCDENYLAYALFAAKQIHDLHPERDFDIVIANSAPLEVPDDFPNLDLRLIVIDTDGAFNGLGLDPRRTESTYLRLALPGVLRADYDTLFYLDSDVFVLRGGFGNLLKQNLDGFPIAAVRDNCQWRTPNRAAPDLKNLGVPAGPYFNAGVLLINVSEFLNQNVLESALVFGARNKDGLLRNDQTVLNGVLRGKWTEMSPRWNWQFTWASRFFALTEDARILHFIGPRKPWGVHDGVFPAFIPREFGTFLERYFPEKTPLRQPVSPLGDQKAMAKSLIKHLISRRRLAAYLDRFPDDMVLRNPGH